MDRFLLHDYRCSKCGKLLLRGAIFLGAVEIKCRRCSWVSEYEVLPKQTDMGYSVVVDCSNKIVAVTSGITKALNYSPTELLGSSIECLNADAALLYNSNLLSNGLSLSTSHRCKDGNDIMINLKISHIGEKNDYFTILECVPKMPLVA